MFTYQQVSAIIYTNSAVIMLLIYFSNRFLRPSMDRVTKIYMKMLGADIVMLLFYTVSVILSGRPDKVFLKSLFQGLGNVCYFLVLIYFAYYVTEFIASQVQISLIYARFCAINGAIFGVLWFISSFNGCIYYIENGVVHRGFLYIPGHLGGCAILLVCIIMILRYRRVIGRRNILAFMLFCLLPTIAVFLRMLYNVLPVVPIMLSCTIVLIQGFSQVEHYREQRIRLERARMAVMMSQIRPHFIYNVLNSIYALCDISTERTKEAIAGFSEYLRTNLSLDGTERMITFSKELLHIENYLELEKLRYGDRLKTVFEVEDRDFTVPILSVQPIVENAVRHGVSKRVEGGTVRLSSHKVSGGHLIEIEDDGVGFDVGAHTTKDENEKGHIGFENVKSRIEAMCGGTVRIKSVISKGTKVDIFVPDVFNGSI